MRSLNRTQLARKYRGKWIALKADRKTVVASAGSVSEVRAKANEQGYKTPVITRMPKSTKSFVGIQRAA